MPRSNPLMSAVYHMDHSPNKHWKYSQYLNLIYIVVVGKTAKDIRKERKLPKTASVKSLLSYTQRKEVEDLEKRVAQMIRMRMSYESIKEVLMKEREVLKEFGQSD